MTTFGRSMTRMHARLEAACGVAAGEYVDQSVAAVPDDVDQFVRRMIGDQFEDDEREQALLMFSGLSTVIAQVPTRATILSSLAQVFLAGVFHGEGQR
jgi:hypothetical protein